MYVSFYIAALFPSPYSRVKKHGKFKINIHLNSVESFLHHLSSNIKRFLRALQCFPTPLPLELERVWKWGSLPANDMFIEKWSVLRERKAFRLLQCYTRWLKSGKVSKRGAFVWDLYILKVLPRPWGVQNQFWKNPENSSQWDNGQKPFFGGDFT